MTTSEPRQRTVTTTWVKALVKSIWLCWPQLSDKRLSAANISSFITDELGYEEMRQYLPEERTIQRIIADFRKLLEESANISKSTSLFDEAWPQDSDDTAYLIALMDSFGRIHHPDQWHGPEEAKSAGISTSTSAANRSRDDYTEIDLGAEISDTPKAETAAMDDAALLPLNAEEIQVALQLKGSFGWPQSFNARRQWTLNHPSSLGEIPGELAIVKEMATRRLYSQAYASEYDGDCSDIISILMERPWQSTRNTWPSDRSQSEVLWRTPRHLDSIIVTAPDVFHMNRLKQLVTNYINTGNQAARDSAQSILKENLPPKELETKIKSVFSPLGRSNSTSFPNYFFNSSYKIDLDQVQTYLTLAEIHMTQIDPERVRRFERLRQKDPNSAESLGLGLNMRHSHQETIRSESLGDVWISLDKQEAAELMSEGNNRRGTSAFNCRGCRRTYLPVKQSVNFLINRRAQPTTNRNMVDKILQTFMDHTDSTSQNRKFLLVYRNLCNEKLLRTYDTTSSAWDDSLKPVRDSLVNFYQWLIQQEDISDENSYMQEVVHSIDVELAYLRSKSSKIQEALDAIEKSEKLSNDSISQS